MKRAFLLSLFVTAFCTATAFAESNATKIIVSAGALDRLQVPAYFSTKELLVKPKALRNSKGEILPLQIAWDETATFIVERLPKGKSLIFELFDELPPKPVVAIEAKAARVDKTIRFSWNDKTVMTYQLEPGPLPRAGLANELLRGGYIQSVFSPSGRLVTDDFPEKHAHHHGIWFPWTKTKFEDRTPDFWNMSAGKGRVEFVALDRHWDGPIHSGLVAKHRFVDLTAKPPKTALDEVWELQMYRQLGTNNPYTSIDLRSTQKCAIAAALELPEHMYGGLGLRGNRAWDNGQPTRFLTSNGETDRKKAHGTRAKWCHIGGEVDGKLTGIAILSHPENFRFPQPMRIHPDEPFFCYAPQQLGDMAIKPGDKYISRYRFIVMDGAPDTGELERLWNDYATPPKVELIE